MNWVNSVSFGGDEDGLELAMTASEQSESTRASGSSITTEYGDSPSPRKCEYMAARSGKTGIAFTGWPDESSLSAADRAASSRRQPCL